jgi:hypothetical protein
VPEFAQNLIRWGLKLDTFTANDVRNKFPNICGRKQRATLIGLLVQGSMSRSTKQDGSYIYWVNKDMAEMLKIG